MTVAAVPDSQLLKEAAEWALVFQYDSPDEAQRLAFERWLRRSPEHGQAWARAQAVFHTFEQVPAAVGKETLKNLRHSHGRRRSLRVLGTVLLAAPVGWLAWHGAAWRHWFADVTTATGERKSLALPDGTQLVLDTASAVDIAYTQTHRRIHLVAGEILITTHPDQAAVARPFVVDTTCGLVRALGTRFSVRWLKADERCRVTVFEDAVEICPLAGAARVLRAGEQADFDVAGVGAPMPAAHAALLWDKGILLAKNMPLGEVIAEMARYRPGILLCDAAVAGMLVSGAIALMDTDAALDLLAQSLSLRVERRTSYWVKVGLLS